MVRRTRDRGWSRRPSQGRSARHRRISVRAPTYRPRPPRATPRLQRLRVGPNDLAGDERLAVPGLVGRHVVDVDAQFAGDLPGRGRRERRLAAGRLGSPGSGRGVRRGFGGSVVTARLCTADFRSLDPTSVGVGAGALSEPESPASGASVVATALRVRPHVGLADPTAGTAPVDDGDVDAQFAGESTGRRRREGPAGRGVGLRLGVGFRVGLGADAVSGSGSVASAPVSAESSPPASTSSPSSPTRNEMITSPTGTISPSSTNSSSTVPSYREGTSTSALSVSTSATG